MIVSPLALNKGLLRTTPDFGRLQHNSMLLVSVSNKASSGMIFKCFGNESVFELFLISADYSITQSSLSQSLIRSPREQLLNGFDLF